VKKHAQLAHILINLDNYQTMHARIALFQPTQTTLGSHQKICALPALQVKQQFLLDPQVFHSV
jgi:hypothetical protein